MDRPKMVKILKKTQVCKDTFDLQFVWDSSQVEPGQFFMIWIPGIDELPMSVSLIHDEYCGITFRVIGEGTHALSEFNEGDFIGVRGPYGNGFDLSSSSLLCVGGGTGTAMIAPLVEKSCSLGKRVKVVIGAKCADELFFVRRVQKCDVEVIVTTDDGSEGLKGYATDAVESMLDGTEEILACGPEQMLVGLLDISQRHDLKLQVSLERYMKCAIGICGQCCLGEGMRVCADGPVFKKEQLVSFEEFGRWKRDASGKRVPLRETHDDMA